MTKRIDEIKNLLLTRKEVTVKQLCKYYNVSAVSIRKDLNKLAEEGIVERVYGGAVLVENNSPARKTSTLCFDNPLKYQLAEKACSSICDGDIIFLGSGRTCCILAKLLNRFSNLSVVTNNITALDDLLAIGARIYLIGGEVTSTDGTTLFSSPEDPMNLTQNIRVNKAFTSISGIDLHKGLTVSSIISTYIYRHLPSIASKWYLMTSSDKFNKLSMYSVASLSDVDCVITDSYPPEYEAFFQKHGTEVIALNAENSDIQKEKASDGETD
ncbi:MAG: Glycerol-3-phosphate regulon repressor [Oscillospiraceae bacterium]